MREILQVRRCQTWWQRKKQCERPVGEGSSVVASSELPIDFADAGAQRAFLYSFFFFYFLDDLAFSRAMVIFRKRLITECS